MKPDRVGRDSAGMESSGHPSSDLDNISHSTTYAFRLLANLNELLTNTNNNLCDVEIVAGKGKNCRSYNLIILEAFENVQEKRSLNNLYILTFRIKWING